MDKRIPIVRVLALGCLLSAAARADESGHISPNPLTLLPGMRQAMKSSPAMPSPTIPVPIISEVTNAPNPFDSRLGGLEGKTQISYALAQNFSVTVTLYDLLGERVRQWEFRPGEEGGRQGTNKLIWDGTNEAGQKVSKGGYLAQIEVDAGGTIATALRKIGVIH